VCIYLCLCALSRPLATLTQKMRLRNTSTVLEEVMPHWPMVPAVGCGPARRAGRAHRARWQWRRRLPTGNCTACEAFTAAPRRRRAPQPQQAPRSYAQPPQSPQGPRRSLATESRPGTGSFSQSLLWWLQRGHTS